MPYVCWLEINSFGSVAITRNRQRARRNVRHSDATFFGVAEDGIDCAEYVQDTFACADPRTRCLLRETPSNRQGASTSNPECYLIAHWFHAFTLPFREDPDTPCQPVPNSNRAAPTHPTTEVRLLPPPAHETPVEFKIHAHPREVRPRNNRFKLRKGLPRKTPVRQNATSHCSRETSHVALLLLKRIALSKRVAPPKRTNQIRLTHLRINLCATDSPVT